MIEVYLFSDQNGAKTIHFGAAHTYMAYIGDYAHPHPPPGQQIIYAILAVLSYRGTEGQISIIGFTVVYNIFSKRKIKF